MEDLIHYCLKFATSKNKSFEFFRYIYIFAFSLRFTSVLGQKDVNFLV